MYFITEKYFFFFAFFIFLETYSQFDKYEIAQISTSGTAYDYGINYASISTFHLKFNFI